MQHIRNRYIEVYRSNAAERTRSWERSLQWSPNGRSTTHNGAYSLKSYVISVKGAPYQTGEAEVRDFFEDVPLLGKRHTNTDHYHQSITINHIHIHIQFAI
jgi:hypothetical protein